MGGGGRLIIGVLVPIINLGVSANAILISMYIDDGEESWGRGERCAEEVFWGFCLGWIHFHVHGLGPSEYQFF